MAKGWRQTPEAIEKIRKNSARLGKKFVFTEEHRRHISESQRGKPGHTLGKRWKVSNPKPTPNRGEKHYKWIKDRTKLQRYNDEAKDRRSGAYREWRKEVWLRDNFKCKIDNPDCEGRIEAHHILGWKEYPELRYQVNNGITLCHFHHPKRREDEKRLQSEFQALVSVSKELI